jgi:hypothetical protein
MAFKLADVMRSLAGRDKKAPVAFKSEREAYDFCRNAYKSSGGVSDDLRKTYEFYVKNFDDGLEPGAGPLAPRNQ